MEGIEHYWGLAYEIKNTNRAWDCKTRWKVETNREVIMQTVGIVWILAIILTGQNNYFSSGIYQTQAQCLSAQQVVKGNGFDAYCFEASHIIVQ